MERAGSGGGFHGYRSSSNFSYSSSEMVNVGLPAEMNHNYPNANHINQAEMINHNGTNNHRVNHTASEDGECMVREQDRFMPIANVIRIMRKILPPHAKISDDAKETIQECVSEYISFITGEANERCQREQRKTITAEDVLWAMSKLGFDDYVEPLTLYLHRYREMEGDRGPLRSDPMGRRTVDFGAPLGVPAAAFAPMFHMGLPPHPHHHPGAGYYGHSNAAAMNGYLKEGSTEAGASSQQAAGGV
ncbi:Nuclear transcription factor Y subunit B-6 [Ancistrocladus abbreviatus]